MENPEPQTEDTKPGDPPKEQWEAESPEPQVPEEDDSGEAPNPSES